MLHVEDAQVPYYRHFDIRHIFEEFVDHLSLFNDLPSKNAFVVHYNEWAQRSNFLLRSLREMKNSWQEMSARYRKFAKARTFLYIVSCLLGLWQGSWWLALFSLTVHIFGESMRPVLDKKVVAATRVKTPLESIFFIVARMKRSLEQIETKFGVLYRFPSTDTSKEKPSTWLFDKTSHRHTQNKTPRLYIFFVVVSILCGIVVFVVERSLYTWIMEAFHICLLSLLIIVAFVLLTSYAVFAHKFIKHATAVRSELAAESYVFMDWFEDWLARGKIRIDFCYFKFCFLNLMCYEDHTCSVGDPYCTFLTVWFLITMERLLRSAVQSGNSQGAVYRLFTNVPVDDESFLEAQYIECCLQNFMKASSPTLDLNCRSDEMTSDRCMVTNNASPPSKHSLIPVFSGSTHLNNVSNSKVCTNSSTCSSHFQNSANVSLFSDKRPRRRCSLRRVSYRSSKSEKSERVRESNKSSLSASSSNTGPSYCTKISAHIPGINANPKTCSHFKRKSSLSSDSVTSSVQGNCSSETSAPESAFNSKEQQRFNYDSSENAFQGVTCLGVSDSQTDRPAQKSVPSSRKCSTPKRQQQQQRRHRVKGFRDDSLIISSSGTSVKSSSGNMPEEEIGPLNVASSSQNSVITSNGKLLAEPKGPLNVPSSSQNSVITSNGKLFAEPTLKVENAKCSPTEKSAADQRRGEESWEGSQNSSFLCVSNNPLQGKSQLPCITNHESPAVISETEKPGNHSTNTCIIPNTDLSPKSCNSDASEKSSKYNEKRSSHYRIVSGLSANDNEFNHSAVLMPHLPKSRKNISDCGTGKIISDAHEGITVFHTLLNQPRKESHTLLSENNTFRVLKSNSSLSGFRDIKNEEPPLSSTENENRIMLSNEYQIGNQAVDSKFSVDTENENRIMLSNEYQIGNQAIDSKFSVVTENENRIVLSNEYQIGNQAVDSKSTVDTPEHLHLFGHNSAESSSDVCRSHRRHFPKMFRSDSSVITNGQASSLKERDSKEYQQTNSYKAKSTENFPPKSPASDAVPLALTDILLQQSHTSLVSQQSGSHQYQLFTTEDDSDELSFPQASSDDENFRFRPESGCTSDTLYSEEQDAQNGPTISWKSDVKKEHDPAFSLDPPKSSSEVKPETAVDGRKGTFKFDNFDFAFDLKGGTENLTLKFYCESEGESTESVPPAKKEGNCRTFPKDWGSEIHYEVPVPLETQNGEHVSSANSACNRTSRLKRPAKKNYIGKRTSSENGDVPSYPVKNCSGSESDFSCADCLFLWDGDSGPCRRDQKRTVAFDLDGICFNFKRRKNSGPVKLHYHQRSEAKDFLFKSRFKRFRFRCGNATPRSGPFEEHEVQVPFDCNGEVEHSGSESGF